MNNVKYPNVTVALTGNDGNAFAVMGAVIKALKKAGVPQDQVDAYQAESMSGDYNNLLVTAMNWVNVT